MPSPGSTLRPTTVSATVRPCRSLAGTRSPMPTSRSCIVRIPSAISRSVRGSRPAATTKPGSGRDGTRPTAATGRPASSTELSENQDQCATAGSASRIRPAAAWFARTAAGSLPPISTPASHVQPNSRGVSTRWPEAGGDDDRGGHRGDRDEGAPDGGPDRDRGGPAARLEREPDTGGRNRRRAGPSQRGRRSGSRAVRAWSSFGERRATPAR